MSCTCDRGVNPPLGLDLLGLAHAAVEQHQLLLDQRAAHLKEQGDVCACVPFVL